MITYHARDLLDYTEDEIWGLELDESCHLVFDDTTLEEVDIADIPVSWYFWQLTTHYHEIPLTSDLFLNGRALTDDVFQDILNRAIQSTRQFDHIDKEDIWLLAYSECYNGLYNALVTRTMDHISSTDGEAILEILDDPEIMEANRQVTPALATVDRAYDTIKRVFKSGKYPHNPIVRAVEYKTVKMNQMLPSFGPRGRVTDIDSVIYRNPVRRGFAMGFTDITDFAKESRSAAKALLFNKDPVAAAEYFNRKLQFVIAYVRKIYKGDCGSTEPHVFYNVGEELFRSMVGLTYLDDKGKKRTIHPEDTHLIGKDISFFTTATCRLLPKQGVCESCYGDVAYAIPHDTNPGHVSCTAINKVITQLIISTKHLDFIIHAFIARLRRSEEAFLRTEEKRPDQLFLAEAREGESITLRILKEEAPRLVDVNYVSDIDHINLARVSALQYAGFYRKDANGVLHDGADFDMVKYSTRASLSPALLKHAKRNGWREDDQFYYIDIDGWKGRNPLFVYPHKHENMSEFGDRVERFIRSARYAGESKVITKESVTMLTRYKEVDKALYDAYYLISEKLDGVYLGHIATILAATRVKDKTRGDWSMPGSIHEGTFQTHDDIIANRSLSVAMLYEGQADIYDNLDSYLLKNRLPSIMDDLIYIPVGDDKP
jgi:hypothetical protein